MAHVGQKDGIYHVRFRFGGREYKKSLKTRSEDSAAAAQRSIELTIHRLITGMIAIPENVDPGDFILSGGTLHEPRRKKAVPPLALPSTKALIEEYKESQRNLLAESYHYSQAMHLRHLVRHLGDFADASCDKVGYRDLDGYLKVRLASRHPNTAERSASRSGNSTSGSRPRDISACHRPPRWRRSRAGWTGRLSEPSPRSSASSNAAA
jgi:hypothetical protein